MSKCSLRDSPKDQSIESMRNDVPPAPGPPGFTNSVPTGVPSAGYFVRLKTIESRSGSFQSSGSQPLHTQTRDRSPSTRVSATHTECPEHDLVHERALAQASRASAPGSVAE